MKLFTEAFLDRWETRATKKGKRWETEVPPGWYVAIYPDILLQPTDDYTVRMCMRQAAFPGVPIMALNALGGLFLLIYLWFEYPAVFHNQHLHKMLIGTLSDQGCYSLPWALPLLLTLNFMRYLPRAYFWNRRAERLRREPPLLSEASVEVAAIDVGVWPPPPKKPVD